MAQAVAGVAAGGLEHQHVGHPHLLSGVAVDVGRAVLLHQVEAALRFVSKHPGLVVGHGDGDGAGGGAVCRGAVGHKVHVVGVALLVVQPQAVGGQLLHDGLPGGDHRVLQAVALAALRVPPHQVAARGTAKIGAVHRVQGGHAPLADLVVGVHAAPGVEEDGVVAQGQLQIVGPGGADGADGAHPVQGLVDAQHAGDAPLGGHLVDDVRHGLPQLGQGLLQVVEHDGHRPAVDPFLPHGQAAEGAHRAIIGGGRGLWCGGCLWGGDGGGTGLRLRSAAGGEQQEQGQQGGQGRTFHGGSSSCFLPLSYPRAVLPSRPRLPHDTVPAHTRFSALGTGQPPPGQGVIALHIRAHAGGKQRVAVGTLEISRPGVQHGGGPDPRHRRHHGKRDHRDPGGRRQIQRGCDDHQGDHRHDGYGAAHDRKGHALFVLLIFPHQIHQISLRSPLIIHLRDALAGEQVVDGDVQALAQWQHQGDLRYPFSALPLGDGLVADAQPFGQLSLGQVVFLPGLGDKFADLNLVHHVPPFCPQDRQPGLRLPHTERRIPPVYGA